VRFVGSTKSQTPQAPWHRCPGGLSGFGGHDGHVRHLLVVVRRGDVIHALGRLAEADVDDHRAAAASFQARGVDPDVALAIGGLGVVARATVERVGAHAVGLVAVDVIVAIQRLSFPHNG